MNMKNIFTFLIILTALCCTAFAASDSEIKQAKREAGKANTHRVEVCRKVISNFNKDKTFVRALSNFCLYCDTYNMNFKQAVYPLTNNHYKGYANVQPIIYSSFVVDSTNHQLSSLRKIVNDYCKYNSYAIRKKDANVCSQQRLNSIFAE